MKKKGFFLKVTIKESKIVSNLNLEYFTLKLKLFHNSITTEKLQPKVYDCNNTFFLEVIPGHDIVNFEISAYSKFIYFFESEICKLNLPLKLHKLLDKNEWYTLKNSAEENVLMIKISFNYEIVNNEKSSNKGDSVLENTIIKNSNKYNISYDNIKLNASRINNSIDDIKTGNNLTQLANNQNNLSCFSKISENKKYDNTVISNNIKSQELSQLNLFNNSRMEERSVNYDQISISRIKKYDESNYISTLDDISEEKEDGNSNERYKTDYKTEVKRKLAHKCQLYNEDKKKYDQLREETKKIKEKLKEKIEFLNKEKEDLERKKHNYNKEKNLVEERRTIIENQIMKISEDEQKLINEKEIFEQEKELFFSLNSINGFNNLLENQFENLNSKLNKITPFCFLSPGRKEVSEFGSDVKLTNNYGNNVNQFILKQNNSTQNFISNSKILNESNALLNTINKSSRQVNSSDIENSKEKDNSQANRVENNKCMVKIQSSQNQYFNSNNQINSSVKIDNNYYSHDLQSAVIKSQSSAIIQTKFYPPIAEINLNDNQMNIKTEIYQNFVNQEIMSPNQKLTDSLEIVISPKKLEKNFLKVNRGGSEEHNLSKKPKEDLIKDKKNKLNVNLSNKKLSTRDKVKKENNTTQAPNQQTQGNSNQTNLISYRNESKNSNTNKIGLKKSK